MRLKIPTQVKLLSLSFLFTLFGYASIQQYITTYFSENNLINIRFNSLILIYKSFC